MVPAVLIRREETQRHTEGVGHVRTETQVRHPQAEECRGLPPLLEAGGGAEGQSRRHLDLGLRSSGTVR